MAQDDSPQVMLGSIIRTQRELAAVPLRRLAAAVGISNPYLSQIERGLRAPSDAVLTAIAESLATSADQLYEDAGFVDPSTPADSEESAGLDTAIAAAVELTAAQRKALLEVYRGFLDANAVRRTRRSRTKAT